VKRVCRAMAGLAILCSVAGVAQQPKFKTGNPEKQKVVEELTYYYEILSYTPPVPVDLTGPHDLSTPETAAMNMLQAMSSMDYQRWLTLWTPESQEMMRKRFQELGKGPELFKNVWSKLFAQQTITLTKRIETGPYVVVVATFSPSGGGEPQDMEFVFTQVKGAWLGSQDLASDPVLLNWREPGTVIKRVARAK
jgi:hypothetical protein